MLVILLKYTKKNYRPSKTLNGDTELNSYCNNIIHIINNNIQSNF